jgi:hypothetical protein
LICCLTSCGCSLFGRGPNRPALNPRQSAKLALETYDTNADGGIDAQEVEQSPGLKVAFQRVDKDGDGTLSAEEIEKRIEYYKTAQTTILSGETRVTLNGRRPLSGATITFEPEEFLGSAFKACSGTTNEQGIAYVTGHDADFPGIYLGFYRVRISKQVNGREEVPSKYNTETEIGYEGADDIPLVSSAPHFDVKK